ncbi:MAG TPA: type II toxin-antitoxin system RelE/ParE family toxin [Rhizomicrobium sp.]|nr:type II toxin-antitoxin system RelE/ParE family toxin [Rhizomicrobium sp.]
MIQSWKGGVAEAIFEGKKPREFPPDVVSAARRRLSRLDAALSLQDLRSPPGNKLHALRGDRKGQWALWINDQFRICFVWGAKGPRDVEIVDYH